MKIYQDANGGWIVFDGQVKHRFGVDEQSANRFYRRLQIMSVIIELQELVSGELVTAQELIDTGSKRKRLEVTNNVAEMIAATEDGALVGDGDWTKERWQELSLLFSDLETWLMTPLEDGQLPLVIISKRV